MPRLDMNNTEFVRWAITSVMAAATAWCAWGVARRLTTPAAAAVAGVLVSLLPAMLTASQVYLLSMGSCSG